MWSKVPAQEKQAQIKQNPNSSRVWSLVRAWLPTLVLLGIIATVSTAVFGSDRTSPFFYRIYVRFFGPTTADNWLLIHIYIRKSGHVLGYGLFSASLFRSWRLTQRIYYACKNAIKNTFSIDTIRLIAHLLAIFGALIVASLDELHQSYIPNRTGSVEDVFLDISAAVATQILIWVAFDFLDLHSKQEV
jgi:VanZ family protein